MTTADALMAIVGSPVDSDAVRTLVSADGLLASTEQDLDEGEEPRSYLAGMTRGYQLVHTGGRVTTAFLYVEPAEGFTAFSGQLPYGLRFNATRTEVRHQFGVPERSGEAATIRFLGRKGAWDRFLVADLYVHFQYTEPEQRMQLITLMKQPSDTRR